MTQEQIERVARAIYEAPDSQSGDTIGTVIWNSDHLFYDTVEGEEIVDRARRASMPVCRDAARAAIEALQPDIRDEALEEAAQVADECVTEAHQQQRKSDEYGDALGGQLASARFRLSTEIAKAIRSLKGSERHG